MRFEAGSMKKSARSYSEAGQFGQNKGAAVGIISDGDAEKHNFGGSVYENVGRLEVGSMTLVRGGLAEEDSLCIVSVNATYLEHY